VRGDAGPVRIDANTFPGAAHTDGRDEAKSASARACRDEKGGRVFCSSASNRSAAAGGKVISRTPGRFARSHLLEPPPRLRLDFPVSVTFFSEDVR
jgi:hypothetical protein